MKKTLLFIALLLSTLSLAQNLTLNELISLRKMDLEDVESFLTKKGWNFKNGTEPQSDKLGSAIFVYGTDGDYEYAESFLNFYYSLDGTNRLSIQISKLNKYNEYLSAVKSFSPTLVKSSIENDNLQKVYKGATTTFQFTTSTSNTRYGDTKAAWGLFIVGNEDYETQYGY